MTDRFAVLHSKSLQQGTVLSQLFIMTAQQDIILSATRLGTCKVRGTILRWTIPPHPFPMAMVLWTPSGSGEQSCRTTAPVVVPACHNGLVRRTGATRR